jgi:glycosyltransferase involved in cell wall biosynthesis
VLVEEIESSQVTAFAGAKPFIVVGVPAFNEEKTIAKIVLEAQKYADRVVVCDDGSTDLTGVIAERLGATVVRHERNLGKGKALKTLFAEIAKLNPDVVVTLDADGQHEPREIPILIKPIVCGESDVVIGNRYGKDLSLAAPLYRRAGLSIINWFNRSVNKLNVRDTQNGFRAYSLRALKIIAMHESEDYSVESEHLILANKAGLKIREVPVHVNYPSQERTSKKSALSHGLSVIGFILRMVVEERPLLLLGVPGTLSLVVGTLFGVWMLQIYGLEHRIVTNVALASIAFILIGLFFTFTAITLYAISRVAQKTNNRH